MQIKIGNAINDVDDDYVLESKRKDEFYLVKTEDLPEDHKIFSGSQTTDSSLYNSYRSLDDNTEEEVESNKNTKRWVEENEESSLDKKSITSSMALSWADDYSPLEEELQRSEKTISTIREELSNLEIPNKQRVTVTHINNPSSFYVHLAKSAKVSAELSMAIAKYTMGSCVKVKPELNKIYLVKFNDGISTQWYRGRIINIHPSNKYTVFFIDYGNTSVVSKNSIRNAPAKLFNIPPLAFECRIFDLWPLGASWDKRASTTMADLVNKESFLMVIIDTSLSVYNVDLVSLDGSTSIRDALIFSELGIPHLKPDSLVTESKKEMASFNVKKDIHKFSKKFTERELVNVIITYVKNPKEVYLILTESQKILNSMQSDMYHLYKKTRKGLVYSLEVGMYVAALYSFRGTSSWFRAIVIEAPVIKGSIKVNLIDLGPTITVEWENVRRLNDKFYATESLSFCVEMMDIEPPNSQLTWPENIREFFVHYINSRIVLSMLVCSSQNPLGVVLIEDTESFKLCVNAKLVAENYGQASGKCATNIKWKTDDDEVNFTTEMLKMIQSTDSIHDESSDCEYNTMIQKEVEVVSAESPSLIYVKFVHIKKKYDELYKEMQSYYANCEFKPQKWSPRDLTAVRYDNKYLRGIVEKKVSENLYKVCLKDIRKDIEVSSEDMMCLEDSFTRCPELITRCHLANIIPAGGSEKWTAMACELLQETLKDKFKILLTKCGKIDMTMRSLPVLLWYTKFVPGGPLQQSKHILCSVNKILLKNGLALKSNVNEVLRPEFERNDSIEKKIWDWLPPTLITDDRILAIPTYVNDHGQIYIHDCRNEAELDKMSDKLTEHFKNSPVDNKSEDWCVGDICIARYFINEQWYRAKVTGINDNLLNVLMVDYGNEEDLQPCHLRKEILFENIPVFASVVYLQNINPTNGVFDVVDLDILHGSIVDKEVDVHFINGHDIHNPSAVYMSYKNISINEFLLTKCKHLENSIEEKLDGSNLTIESVSDYESDGGPDVLILDEDSMQEAALNYKVAPLPDQKDIEIVIINLLYYNVVVFELTDYENINEDNFEKMQAQIQSEVAGVPTLTSFQLDTPCIVKYTQDDLYYRGKILGIRDNDILVWFVDYGNFEFIPKSEVKEMLPQWLDYPIQHHIAEIDGIQLADKDKESVVKERLASFYSTKVVANIKSKDPLRVSLFDTAHKLIYQNLIDDGTLQSNGN